MDAMATVLTCIVLVTLHIWNKKAQYLPSDPMAKQYVGESGKFSTYLKHESATEPIDLVYTWVNGSDEMFLETMSNYVKLGEFRRNRYDDHNELLFSLRSVEKFAPWIRNIYIVTNGQIPHWLNLENTRVSIVSHIEICPPELIEKALPTFSSSAIEMMLHRIPNLSEQFLYMNDDFYLGRPLLLEDLRTDQHGIYIWPAWPFPYCSETCKWRNIGDNVCNEECYQLACNFDGGDCESIIKSGHWIGKDIKSGSAYGDDVKHNYHSKSLTYTHGVLSRRYGFKARNSMAHVGILIEKEVMRTIENVFKQEVRDTISHRFRHGEALQFQLVYTETLLSEMRERTEEEIFSLFAVDESGTLTNDEVKQFLKEYHDLSTLNRTHFEHVSNVATKWNAGDNFTLCNGLLLKRDPFSCDGTLLNSTKYANQFCKKFGSVQKFKGTTHPAPETFSEYAIVTTNLDEAKQTFDRLLSVRKSFHCINDVIEPTIMNYVDSDAFKEINELWLQFYLKLFPDPSEFELQNGVRNSYRHIDEYRKASSSMPN